MKLRSNTPNFVNTAIKFDYQISSLPNQSKKEQHWRLNKFWNVSTGIWLPTQLNWWCCYLKVGIDWGWFKVTTQSNRITIDAAAISTVGGAIFLKEEEEMEEEEVG